MTSREAVPLRFQTAEVGVDWLQCNIECQEGCPVNTNCRGYLMLAAEGRFEEGYILARDPNPVAAICGYVCSAPCEKACRRADIDKPLAIRAMKRFLVDWHYANNMPDDIQVAPATGKSVAVIGAGPAGLSAAKELAGWGHEVHVYDALPSGGGTTLIGVPAFRLPRDVIELDVNWVAKHGVEFHYNVEIGRDLTLDQLRARHDAVVVATGCMYPVAMNVPGEELDGVIYGVDFLKRANLGQEQWVGDHVVVVGGGYTAMDSSRTALRLGAKTSTIVYRRGPEEMVVDEEEQHETRFEGVRFGSDGEWAVGGITDGFTALPHARFRVDVYENQHRNTMPGKRGTVRRRREVRDLSEIEKPHGVDRRGWAVPFIENSFTEWVKKTAGTAAD
jgi:NADPH-dependent glutamate synthase beta subunit-like oxidoreductase